ncbi:MAG: glycosyltransferase family 2 protein [Flavobacteriaceae bacterium]
MRIAIAILNFNGAKLLERFLPSILKHSTEAAVYVVDNGSTDDSKKLLMEKFPQVTSIILDTNLGYAAGYNKAVKEIKESIICFLNSDVQVTQNWTTPIIDFFSDNPEVAVIQPKIKDLNNPDYFEYAGAAGGFLDFMGLPYCRGRFGRSCAMDKGQYDDNTAITWASGACFFVRKSVFETLNGFDSTFFMHFEEIDFCLRAKNMGHKIWYVGASCVYHQGAASLLRSDARKLFYNIRNSLLTYTKSLSLPVLLWVYVARGFFDTALVLLFMVQLKFTHADAIFQAYDSFLRHYSSAWKLRKHTSNPLQLFSSLLSR